MKTTDSPAVGTNFIKQIIQEDLKAGSAKKIVTRFPPEPNGYLHIGHSKAICLNHSLAQEFDGTFHLRFDDTNPEKEKEEYIEAIKKDMKWLGADWGENLFFSSDYFDQLYDWACYLIEKDLAYVCHLTPDEARQYRGDLKNPGKNSPHRDRSAAENLQLFQQMKEGKFEEGHCVLRAKIDMSHPNIKMRDPIIYRIKKASHPRTGDKWKIYPMYDFTHGQSDAIEGITHSLCTLEFEDHRPLYDWFIEHLPVPHRPRQYEFARLNIDFTVMSKRKLKALVDTNSVDGWDDPRMPTISAFRRRGVLPESIRRFSEIVGVTKKNSVIALSTLESCIRDDLNAKAHRVMAVLDPIKVTITNYESEAQTIESPIHPHHPEWGNRNIPFSKEIYIDREDFMMDPPKKYHRLSPGKRVRLRYAYVIECDEVVTDSDGNITELKCTYFPETFAGVTPEGMPKVKGIIHWVDQKAGLPIKVNLYDRLFAHPRPDSDKEKDFTEFLNPDSLKVMENAVCEPYLLESNQKNRFQFERLGYFYRDYANSDQGKPVFNRSITLRDSWAKIEKQFE